MKSQVEIFGDKVIGGRGERDGGLNGVDFQVGLRVNSVVGPDIRHCKHPFLPTLE